MMNDPLIESAREIEALREQVAELMEECNLGHTLYSQSLDALAATTQERDSYKAMVKKPRGWWNPKYPTLSVQLTKPHDGGEWEPFYTAPPLPEPAPDWLLKTTQNLALHMAKEFFPDVPQFEVMADLAGVISQIDNMVCGLPREPITVCAAQSSEEVRETVERLRCFEHPNQTGEELMQEAADLIERLAARVTSPELPEQVVHSSAQS